MTLLKGYMNVPCVFYSTAIFLFFRHVNFEKWDSRVKVILNYLSTETFSVYLTHMFVITGLTAVFKVSWDSFINRTVGAVAVFLTITVVCKQLKKVSLFRLLLP